MDLEQAVAKSQELIKRDRANPGSVSDSEIADCMEALRQARKAAPGARGRGKSKAVPVDLDTIFGTS
jgi:hypothetical protein